MCTVIDANCLKGFQDERISGVPDVFTIVITRAIERGCIAIDDKGMAVQEYNDCCKPSAVGLNLCDWIADQIVNKVIEMFAMDRCAEKELKAFGVPKADLKWPAIAIGSKSDSIVSDDIDLFDPKAKKQSSASKEKIKQNGGKVSHFLYKKYEIIVLTSKKFAG